MLYKKWIFLKFLLLIFCNLTERPGRRWLGGGWIPAQKEETWNIDTQGRGFAWGGSGFDQIARCLWIRYSRPFQRCAHNSSYLFVIGWTSNVEIRNQSKVQLFWEDHKISQLFSNCFDKSAEVNVKTRGRTPNFCGLLRKA